jgi:hypothetical protein
MTEPDHADAPELAPPRLDDLRLQDRALDVGFTDVLVALLTFCASLAVLGYGLNAFAVVPVSFPISFPIFLGAHLAVLIIPAAFLLRRSRNNGDRNVPALLLVATFAAGPVGALGCALMALALRLQHPSPARLQHWYDYIAGIVARSDLTRIYDELSSGRLPSDPAARVPRFRPILDGASIEEQQRVLGVIGRRYHADFRPALRNALRNKNGFIRAQAAAVASRLSIEEKNRLWSAGRADETAKDAREPAHEAPDQATKPDALDAEAQRP